MNTEENLAHYVVPSNKFYPPHIDESQSLLRDHLLKSKLPDARHNKKIIIIEAQAGQGKTTLAYQFLQFNNNHFIWYQVGPEDSDPIFLLSSLLTNLSQNLDGFDSPQLNSILWEGSVGPLDLTRCASILLRDLDAYLKEDIYLVFDDLHLIEFGALTANLLEFLIDCSPPRLHFVLTSRQPIEIKGKTIRDGSRIAYLNTSDLALDNLEIETLFNAILKKQISSQEALQIQRITNGWIMGIILASHPISGREKFWLSHQTKTKTVAETKSGHMLDYFQDEIFAQIPDHLHLPFLKISFLQEIPADLAVTITGLNDFASILKDLSEENYFIYSLDDRNHVFRFHHFFQEFLQQRGRLSFSEFEIQDIYSAEGRYYLERDQTEKALTCYRNAKDFFTMENILKERGMGMISKNRTLTILNLLQTIPEETLHAHSWLTLYAGLMRIDYVPQTTLPFFDIAIEKFTAEGDETGELIALSQTIYYHFVISGKYNSGAGCLPRTQTLLEKNKDNLPVPIIIMAARALAAGYCFFISEMDRARHYIQLATTLATRHNLQNFIAHARFIQGYIELLSGNRAKYLREAELCNTLMHDPLVGESNRLTMRVMNLCYLSMIGDQLNYQNQQLALQNAITHTVVDQTVAAPYLYVWGAGNLISAGEPQKALALLEKGMGITSTANTAHMQSQNLQWQAYGLALTGYHNEAVEKITEAVALREEAGGPFYIAFQAIIAGAVYTRVGDFPAALTALEKGLAIAQRIPSTYLTIFALLNMAYFKLLSEGPDAALEDLETGLSLMKINGFDFFWGWEPAMLLKLLSLAVSRDIEDSFAKKLARKRLKVNLSDTGEPIPLLKFVLMDNFEISMNNNILFRAKDLTPFQRELLGLLITAKGQRIPQEKIQLELWPESPPENARKSFDTLLTRLRKLIGPHLDVPVKDYLYLQKGILCLTNYEIDALQFVEEARTGLSHSKNSDWLQADYSFQTALSLWKDALPEDVFQSEQVLSFNDTLTHLLTELALVWSEHLIGSGRLDKAITILERVLRINYLDEELTAILYRCHLQNNNHLKAKDVLDHYRKALVKAEYTDEEITEIIDELVLAAQNRKA